MAQNDIPAQSPLGKQSVPSYEEQLATIESMMTCYDNPLTQAAGYTRDLLRTINALRQREIAGIDPLDTALKEPGECWPRTLRQHINAISRDNVMVGARDVWRILDALLPLIKREPVEVSREDIIETLRKRSDMAQYILNRFEAAGYQIVRKSS